MVPWPGPLSGLAARSSRLPYVSRKLPSADGNHLSKEVTTQEMAHSLQKKNLDFLRKWLIPGLRTK